MKIKPNLRNEKFGINWFSDLSLRYLDLFIYCVEKRIFRAFVIVFRDVEEHYERRERWTRPRSLVPMREEEQREIGKVGQVLEDEVRRRLRKPGSMNYERETKRDEERKRVMVEHEGILQPAVLFF